MNSVKITYMVLSFIEYAFLFAFSVAAPIYVTPGYYWWTAIGIYLMYECGCAFGRRLNSWGF